MNILVTGGAGYIGSHTIVELLGAGYDIVVMDNYSNSDPSVIGRIAKIMEEEKQTTGAGTQGRIIDVVEGDVCDRAALRSVFEKNSISAVIHFAGYKAVGESVEIPLMYYRNNLESTMNIAECMKEFGTEHIIFSSSATVYGMNNSVPFVETMPVSCTNPYGWTKLMSEQILRDMAAGAPDKDRPDYRFRPVLLRYFNPVGAHRSGMIGENPRGIPNNLMPYIQQVADGIREKLTVFGDDYDTPDGTGVRDYIHVTDLAKGHVKALTWALSADDFGGEAAVFNLGTGKGTSVLELVNAFAEVNGVEVPYVIGPRRAGDIATCYADASRAKEILGWEATLGIEDMCRDSWRWQRNATEERSR
ncbi:MAG: UDP-glucose 4-epimerase GalE [Lentihominibacter sp.]